VQCVVTSPPYWGLRDYGVTGQIGLEQTPQEYVARMVEVFREVRRVLRDDGTCWVNLGDSYANNGVKNPESVGGFTGDRIRAGVKGIMDSRPRDIPHGLKPKDLVGIPWRVAFALQADGWYLRSDIIWSKPNPMPESVTDRPTKAHEYVFLLAKRERYYFDQDAVRESFNGELHAPGNKSDNGRLTSSMGHFEEPDRIWGNLGGRNIRTVWEIATQPFPQSHFATFPEELAIRCIKAGTSEKGCCATCGAPRERVTETTKTFESGSGRSGNPINGKQNLKASETNSTPDIRMGPTVKSTTLGWQPTCKHNARAPTKPCIVLDPFGGAGTVALVADKLNRTGIAFELKREYCQMARKRCYDDSPLFA
jgi:DNA modification methylase